MSDHRATIDWSTTAPAEDFRKGRYSRAHRWAFDGGVTLAGSSSPSVVPAPWSDAAAVDPEEAFVAAVASCHMLSFLYVAAQAGFAATAYRDEAVGVMSKTKPVWVEQVTLAPRITWADDKTPTAEELEHLHHRAHEECFIANSVKTSIVVT